MIFPRKFFAGITAYGICAAFTDRGLQAESKVPLIVRS